MANDLLKNLCDYYLNCISLESGNTISQPLSGRGKLQYIPVSGLEINPELDRSLTAFLIGINMSKDLKAYLGYPIRIYTSYEKSDKPS